MIQSLPSSLLLLLLFPLQLALFLLPGLSIALMLTRRRWLPPEWIVMTAICFSSLIGYVGFWCYFLDPAVGRRFAMMVLLGDVGALVWCGVRARIELRSPDFVLPLVGMTLVGLFYLSLTYAVTLDVVPEEQAQYRFLDYRLPPDNVLPFWFAERLAAGQDPRPLFLSWHSSDRPPLQTGIFLMQWSLADWTGLSAGLLYAILGCALQCAWFPAVWALGRTGGLTNRQLVLVLAFLTFSGTVLVNSVFVWPKFLAGGLALFAATVLLSRSVATVTEVLIGALAGALAFLAHGGAAFTLLTIGLVLLLPRYFPGVRRLAAGLALFAVLWAPWFAYQKWFDPPGDRLPKLHLAGVALPDPRSTGQAIREEYAALSVRQALLYKWRNLEIFFVEDPRKIFGSPAILDYSAIAWFGFRRTELHNLFYLLGVLNVGWLVLLRTWEQRAAGLAPALRFAKRILLFTMLNLALWVLLMFGPGTTVIHQGSYAVVLLLFTALAVAIGELPGPWPWIVLALHGARFLAVWIVFVPAYALGQLNPYLSMSALVCAGCLVLLGARVLHHSQAVQVIGDAR